MAEDNIASRAKRIKLDSKSNNSRSASPSVSSSGRTLRSSRLSPGHHSALGSPVLTKEELSMQEVLIPKEPATPILIGRNVEDGKFVTMSFTRQDTHNACMYLKYYGLKKFWTAYLPPEINSLHLYFMIRLLGFELKDRDVSNQVFKNVEEWKRHKKYTISYADMNDPLDKKATVLLIKNIYKAINKVLCSRMRLMNFFTIDHVVDRLLKAKRVLVLTGAGISTSLGIPDFRSSEGFYTKIRYLGLEDPQDVFNYEGFLRDPSIFYNIANLVLPPENIYSPLHSFIKLLQDKKKLLRNYSQNIDNLESYAGIDASKLIQCHGSFATASCVTCKWSLPGDKIFKYIRNFEIPLCPHCYETRTKYLDLYERELDGEENIPKWFEKVDKHTIRSYGVIKPDITFFGEPLPSKFHKSIKDDILRCDLLLCIGTSLKVAPVSEIVNMLPAHVPQVLINRDPVRHAEFDVTTLGYCDDIATMIAQKCGWDIPHQKWETELKNKKFDIKEKSVSVFSIVPSN